MSHSRPEYDLAKSVSTPQTVAHPENELPSYDIFVSVHMYIVYKSQDRIYNDINDVLYIFYLNFQQ